MSVGLIEDGLILENRFFQEISGCSDESVKVLREKLIKYELEQRPVKIECGLDEGTFFGAHHFLRLDVILEKFISNPRLIAMLTNLFGGPPILNSLGLSIVPSSKLKSSYVHGANLHRDQRSFHDSKTPRNIWILVMLDNFTLDNGATLFYKKSHNSDGFTAQENLSFRACGKLGDCVIYDGRTHHTSMPNYMEMHRVAMTISFTPAYVKPQFDYLGLYEVNEIKSMEQEMLQILGFFSRVPKAMTEWYAIPEKRFYRGGQG